MLKIWGVSQEFFELNRLQRQYINTDPQALKFKRAAKNFYDQKEYLSVNKKGGN